MYAIKIFTASKAFVLMSRNWVLQIIYVGCVKKYLKMLYCVMFEILHCNTVLHCDLTIYHNIWFKILKQD